MKQVNVILSVLTLVSISLFSSAAQKKTDLEINNLDGKVKNVVTYVMKQVNGKNVKGQKKSATLYNTKGFITQNVLYDIKGGILRKEIRKYDSNGYFVEELIYDKNDKLSLRYKFNLDKDGNRTIFYIDEGDGRLRKVESYKYDTNGNMIEEINYDTYGSSIIWTSVYKYDAEGNEIENKCNYTNGVLKHKFVSKYDKINNVKEGYKYTESEEKLTQKAIWKKNNKGKIIESSIETFGENIQIAKFNYDAKGNLSEMIVTEQDGKFIEGTIYEYVYY
ncbi:MAG: hypothetical protein UE068_14180 [Paludibacteraceae bacterium]|nr:hypothetical protein [Paludibacteraceae bacterium]